jgi:hypothetical protein
MINGRIAPDDPVEFAEKLVGLVKVYGDAFRAGARLEID